VSIRSVARWLHTCTLASEFLTGHITQETAGAFETLLHESLHRQGIRNERDTETFAIASMRAAGQLVDYNHRVYAAGWNDVPADARAQSELAGRRAERLAWQQAQKMVARNYLSPWSQVVGLHRNPVFNWSDYVSAGL
jgi:hypothetical protein